MRPSGRDLNLREPKTCRRSDLPASCATRVASESPRPFPSGGYICSPRFRHFAGERLKAGPTHRALRTETERASCRSSPSMCSATPCVHSHPVASAVKRAPFDTHFTLWEIWSAEFPARHLGGSITATYGVCAMALGMTFYFVQCHSAGRVFRSKPTLLD